MYVCIYEMGLISLAYCGHYLDILRIAIINMLELREYNMMNIEMALPMKS